jgi:hypothetical protein
MKTVSDKTLAKRVTSILGDGVSLKGLPLCLNSDPTRDLIPLGEQVRRIFSASLISKVGNSLKRRLRARPNTNRPKG